MDDKWAIMRTADDAPGTSELRFTFGQVYLLDGFSLTIVALGLFGVAEAVCKC